jgi:hypothetical protein
MTAKARDQTYTVVAAIGIAVLAAAVLVLKPTAPAPKLVTHAFYSTTQTQEEAR